jgi:hypothetical protein
MGPLLLCFRLCPVFYATGWTVQESNPGGGGIFPSRPDRSWGSPSLVYSGYSFPRAKWRDVSLTTHPI